MPNPHPTNLIKPGESRPSTGHRTDPTKLPTPRQLGKMGGRTSHPGLRALNVTVTTDLRNWLIEEARKRGMTASQLGTEILIEHQQSIQLDPQLIARIDKLAASMHAARHSMARVLVERALQLFERGEA